MNVSALTRHHALSGRPLYPMSRLFTFESGQREVRIQCYLPTTDHGLQGWYAAAERAVPLRMPYRR